ncbi:hypothetical protein [Pseudomonas kitaguniensis]|uniref:hypothetical protein n=1 Tax=Pseudomonas kitaguniensis TaxID=2607908 RepID=UPI003CFDD6DA
MNSVERLSMAFGVGDYEANKKMSAWPITTLNTNTMEGSVHELFLGYDMLRAMREVIC